MAQYARLQWIRLNLGKSDTKLEKAGGYQKCLEKLSAQNKFPI